MTDDTPATGARGIPPDRQPPPQKVRSFLSTGRAVGQYLGTLVVAGLGLGLAAFMAVMMPLPLKVLGSAAAVMGFGTFVYLATRNDYRWVELEGATLRAKHFYTGRLVVRSVAEIESLKTVLHGGGAIETALLEKLLGRIKGVDIRFRDGRTPLRVQSSDPAMTNATELIRALLIQMASIGELDTTVASVRGQPLVQRVHYKGRPPGSGQTTDRVVVLACVMGLALLFGAITAFWRGQEKERLLVGSAAPHEMSLRSLVRDGPGSNRHVVVTGYRPGGYVVESDADSWSRVWIALFPAEEKEPREIRTVLASETVGNEEELARLLRPGRLDVMCSSSTRSSWGATLGPNLEKANGGLALSAVWSLEDLRTLPSESRVRVIFASSAGCLSAVIVLSLLVVRLARPR